MKKVKLVSYPDESAKIDASKPVVFYRIENGKIRSYESAINYFMEYVKNRYRVFLSGTYLDAIANYDFSFIIKHLDCFFMSFMEMTRTFEGNKTIKAYTIAKPGNKFYVSITRFLFVSGDSLKIESIYEDNENLFDYYEDIFAQHDMDKPSIRQFIFKYYYDQGIYCTPADVEDILLRVKNMMCSLIDYTKENKLLVRINLPKSGILYLNNGAWSLSPSIEAKTNTRFPVKPMTDLGSKDFK